MTIQQARQFSGNRIGLPATFDGSVSAYRDLSAAQQVALNAAVLNLILAQPQDFTPAQVETARVEINRAQGQITADPTFTENVATFWDEFETQALNVGQAVANVGTGVINSVSLVGTLLPIVVIGALVIFALPYIKTATK